MERSFMAIRRIRPRAIGLSVALLSILLVQSATAPHEARQAARADDVQALRGEGRYDEAMGLAIRLAEELETTPDVPSWRREDAARLVRTCALAAALPDSCRQTLAEADRADRTIHELIVNGGYRQANALAQLQFDTRQRLLGPDHIDAAASLMALGEIRYLRGDRAGASALRKQGHEIRRAILGDRHPLVAESAAALGRSAKNFYLFDQAESLHTEALDLRRALFGNESIEVAESLHDLADVRRAERNYDSALELLDRCLRIRRRLLPPDAPEIAEALCSIGLVHLQCGHLASAEPYLRSAARIAVSRPNDVSPESRALIFSLCSDTFEKRGDFEQAERFALASVRLHEGFLREGLKGYPPNHGLADWWKVAMLELMQGKSDSAWNSLERGLSRSLLDQLLPPDSSSARGWTGSDPPVDSRFCSVQDLQRVLPADAAVIGWLEGSRNRSDVVDYPYWGYVIRASGPIVWVRVDAPPGSPDGARSTAMSSYMTTLRNSGEWPLHAPMNAELMTLARTAYTERITPLIPYLGGIRRMYVVKAGSIHRAALEALLDSTGTFLGDRFEISYIPSSTLLVRMHEAHHGQRPHASWRVLLVGGDPGEEPDAGVSGSRDPSTGSSHTGLVSLPGARDEICGLAGLFRGTRVLLGGGGQKAALLRLAQSDSLREFDLIHIATHAVVSGTRPMESALVFAPGPRTPPTTPSSAGEERDFLRPQDILSTWHLNADLVTLSSCRSDVGVFYFTEPVSGLCQALFLTGARSLLVALWSVDDRATALLMERFYENLTGSYSDMRSGGTGLPMSKPLALQEAKRWLREFRDPGGSRPFENPALWAAFVLVGDPGDLRAEDSAQRELDTQ
jgi:CHAT domain-containing protein/tetratricopeptide (TPR) repeat protein